jgi:hypothetical protein
MSCRTFNRSGKKDSKKPNIGYRELQKRAHEMILENAPLYLETLHLLFVKHKRVNAGGMIFKLAFGAEIEEPEKPRRMHILDFWASEPEWTPELQREKEERERQQKQREAEQQKQQEEEQNHQQGLAQQQAAQQTETHEPAASINTENQNQDLAAEIGLPGLSASENTNSHTTGFRRCNGETQHGPSNPVTETNELNPPGATTNA